MFARSFLCGFLSVFSTCADLQQSQTAWKGKVTEIKVLQSSHASPLLSLSLRLDTSHKTIYLGVSEHRGKQWTTWCFLKKMWGETDCKNPCGTNPPPPLHLVPQCLLTVERGNMDEGTAGREMERDVQKRGARRGRLKLVNWDCFWLVLMFFSWGMKWETDTRRGRWRIKRQAQEQKQRHLIWNRISEVAW